MTKFSTWIKAHKVWSIIIAVVVVGLGYFIYSKVHKTSAQVQYITQQVQSGTITATVTGTGQVSEENSIQIKAQGQNGAYLTAVDVTQGQAVKAGQTIAVVDEKANISALDQAEANLASAKANYANVLAGATSTDIQSAQDTVNQAQNTLNEAQTNYNTVVAQQQTDVNNALSTLLNTGLAAVPAATNISTATISISGAYTGTAQGNYIVTVVETGAGYSYEVSGLETYDGGQITRGIPQPLGKNGLYITFSSTGTLNMNDSWTISLPNNAASGYLSAYNAYQTALQNQTQALQNAQQTITNDKLALQSAQDAYNSKVAPPTNAQVESAAAQVQNAEASVQAAQTNYDNNILKSPFDGIVAQLNNQVGDQVTNTSVIATIITPDQLVVVPLNEVDVTKVAVGDKANLTFDAIDGLNITGTVAEIDSIGTVSQGVVTYNIKIGFDTQDPRVKPDMTANASIITAVATDAMYVPNSAVKSNSNGSYVQVLNAQGAPQIVPVTTGISNDTDTQITSGLQAGQSVVTQTITSSSTKPVASSSAGASSGLRIGGGLGGGGGFGGGGGGGARTTTSSSGKGG